MNSSFSYGPMRRAHADAAREKEAAHNRAIAERQAKLTESARTAGKEITDRRDAQQECAEKRAARVGETNPTERSIAATPAREAPGGSTAIAPTRPEAAQYVAFPEGPAQGGTSGWHVKATQRISQKDAAHAKREAASRSRNVDAPKQEAPASNALEAAKQRIAEKETAAVTSKNQEAEQDPDKDKEIGR
jgi:hypothetical protein